jgi:hypothetical protein
MSFQLDYDENDYDKLGIEMSTPDHEIVSRKKEQKCYNLLITMCNHLGIEDKCWNNPQVKSLYGKIITKQVDMLKEKESIARRDVKYARKHVKEWKRIKDLELTKKYENKRSI